MPEIKKEPLRLVVDGEKYEAFSEAHSLADVTRWLLKNIPEAEEVHRMLSEALESNKEE